MLLLPEARYRGVEAALGLVPWLLRLLLSPSSASTRSVAPSPATKRYCARTGSSSRGNGTTSRHCRRRRGGMRRCRVCVRPRRNSREVCGGRRLSRRVCGPHGVYIFSSAGISASFGRAIPALSRSGSWATLLAGCGSGKRPARACRHETSQRIESKYQHSAIRLSQERRGGKQK